MCELPAGLQLHVGDKGFALTYGDFCIIAVFRQAFQQLYGIVSNIKGRIVAQAQEALANAPPFDAENTARKAENMALEKVKEAIAAEVDAALYLQLALHFEHSTPEGVVPVPKLHDGARLQYQLAAVFHHALGILADAQNTATANTGFAPFLNADLPAKACAEQPIGKYLCIAPLLYDKPGVFIDVYAIRSGHLLALTASTGNDKCRVVDPDIHRLESWICDISH